MISVELETESNAQKCPEMLLLSVNRASGETLRSAEMLQQRTEIAKQHENEPRKTHVSPECGSDQVFSILVA